MKNLIIILLTLSLVQIAKAQTVYYWADGKKNELETDNSQFIVRFTAPKVISELGKNALLQNNKNISAVISIKFAK
jgi:hypothetical protein